MAPQDVWSLNSSVNFLRFRLAMGLSKRILAPVGVSTKAGEGQSHSTSYGDAGHPGERNTLVRTTPICILIFCLAAGACCAAGAHPAAAPAATALDARIQRIAGEELDRIVAEWSPSRAVAVVLDPRSGEVLAMDGRAGRQRASALASNQAWVTGSTLKTLTVAATLEEHTITLEQRFGCGRRVIGGETFHDGSEAPCDTLDAAGVLAKSSNVARRTCSTRSARRASRSGS